jgi:hypothetical protein
MNNPQSTDLTGTLIADLIAMVQKLMGTDQEPLACGNLLWGRPTVRLPGLTPETYNPGRYRDVFFRSRVHAIDTRAQSSAQ